MENSLKKYLGVFLVGALTLSLRATPQQIQLLDAAEIQIALQKLNVLGSVLYIAAHPDDENTAALAYFSKGQKLRTAYLSLTRGDGGQNLIGPEKGAEIGIIRTQELLAAREIDGGEQYFTRAIDYGYSKTMEETLSFWGKEAVLSDIVWIIRTFRPDIVITRFPADSTSGHGHHSASGLLVKEAFRAAADPQKYPEQLEQVEPWQAKRLFWNSWRPNPQDIEKAVKIDVGEFNPLLGTSYSEIAARSRSMHKSQGFGSAGRRGARYDYFQLIDGTPLDKGLFEGIDTSWARIAGGRKLGVILKEIADNFDPQDPTRSLPKLLDAYTMLNALEESVWTRLKEKELLSAIQSCAGLWMEAISADFSASPGDEILVTTTLVNRSDLPFQVQGISFPEITDVSVDDTVLENNIPVNFETSLRIPSDFPISQPFWLKDESESALFSVSEQTRIDMAENEPSIQAKVRLLCRENFLEFLVPVLYRWTDRAQGELYRPFEIRPHVMLQLEDRVRVFADNRGQEIRVRIKANSPDLQGSLRIQGPSKWRVIPESIPFTIAAKYEEAEVSFQISPPEGADEAVLSAEAEIAGKIFDRSLVEIAHSHIKRQVYFPESRLKVVKLDIKRSGQRIGYIMGSGDLVPEGLRNLGYEVILLSDEDLESAELGSFDAIIAGIRAYNTRERIKTFQPRFLRYVHAGGTMIVQYNVSRGLLTESLGPYPISLGRDRVSEENAPVTFLAPDHVLLNFPNKITQKDFEGWEQERGLYFASQWDEKYDTVLASHDLHESEKAGGLLYARYGKGVFIYTGFSWFRQLPAGVPGAYRLFANLISAGKTDAN